MGKMSECKKNLLLFFNRPKEPCFLEKGDDDTVFRCPSHYYPDKFKGCTENFEILDDDIEYNLDLSPRILKTNKKPRIVDVRDITLPDLSPCLQLPYNEHFSLFVPKHRRIAGKLIDIFLKLPDLEDLQAFCAYSQMRINPYMFNYCLSVAILHRPDTHGLDVPSLVESFPDKFICPQILRKAREISSVLTPDQRKLLTMPRNHTASDSEPEQRVAYFREDIGVNLHHWHWHLVYPSEATATLVNKDRRGELFYYMHQQIIARYNAERFCNGLSRTRPYEDFKEPIQEGYFPKLTTGVASRTWQPRYAGTTPSDINRPADELKIDVFEMGVLKERILQAIENMAVRLPDNKFMLLDKDTGIDVLGNLIEASDLSPNKNYYGNYHNTAHLFICYSHDPDNRHLEFAGVMGDSGTAMRDPVFYRLHTHIDELFQHYKRQLPPYPKRKLEFPGVRISRLRIESAIGKEKGYECEEEECEDEEEYEEEEGEEEGEFEEMGEGEEEGEFEEMGECEEEGEFEEAGECEEEREFEEKGQCEEEGEFEEVGECEEEGECEEDSQFTLDAKYECEEEKRFTGARECEKERECSWERKRKGERKCKREQNEYKGERQKRKNEGAKEVFELSTQWEQSVVDLDWGLDFTRRGHMLTSFTHLAHDDFYYAIEVNNTSGQAVQGTVRLFLAPLHDEHGRALSFEVQRTLMIELDKFTHKIPVGASTIRRSSKDSSVTIPYERTFRAQSARSGKKGTTEAAPFDFCGCGWPHHMLIPKGTTEGYPMVLFCMISNWAKDKVDQDLAGTCSDAASYCGIRDRKYPDRRAMGFPFDRRARVVSLPEFLTPNMAVSNVIIRFKDEVRIHGQKAGELRTENAFPLQPVLGPQFR